MITRLFGSWYNQHAFFFSRTMRGRRQKGQRLWKALLAQYLAQQFSESNLTISEILNGHIDDRLPVFAPSISDMAKATLLGCKFWVFFPTVWSFVSMQCLVLNTLNNKHTMPRAYALWPPLYTTSCANPASPLLSAALAASVCRPGRRSCAGSSALDARTQRRYHSFPELTIYFYRDIPGANASGFGNHERPCI